MFDLRRSKGTGGEYLPGTTGVGKERPSDGCSLDFKVSPSQEDELHLLLAMGPCRCPHRPSDPATYLVSGAAVVVPMIDRCFPTPLEQPCTLAGPIWVHRCVTPSILPGRYVEFAATVAGKWRAGGVWVPGVRRPGPRLRRCPSVLAVRRNNPRSVLLEPVAHPLPDETGIVGLVSGLDIPVEIGRPERGNDRPLHTRRDQRSPGSANGATVSDHEVP